MKKIIGIILLVVVFIGCDTGTGGNGTGNTGTGNEAITIDKLSIKTTGIKSLYISNIPVNNSAMAVGGNSVIQTLSYINNLGQNIPFFFVSPSDKNIVLSVSDLQQLDEKRILVDFTSFYEITIEGNVYTIGETITNKGRALIDMASGKVYDFKGYNNIQFVNNDLLFTLENNTLYKIDLNNMSVATPLNNSAYNPIYELDPPVLIGDKIIGYYDNQINSHYVYDINNEFPLKPLGLFYLTQSICSFVVKDYNEPVEDIPIIFSLNPYIYSNRNWYSRNSFIIQDLEGSSWSFTISGDYRYNYTYYKYNKYLIGKITINDNGETNLSDYSEGSTSFDIYYYGKYFPLNNANIGKMTNYDYDGDKEIVINNGMLILFDSGFISLKKKANGIQVESTALTIPNVDKNSSFINKDNYLYYIEGSSIKRLYLHSGSSPETIYTNSRLLTGGTDIDFLNATGNNLVFYQFESDNITVNTYSIPMYQTGATPKLLSSNSADIRNIVELDF